MAPAVDRSEVDLHAEAAGPPWDHEGDLVPHSADGHGESGVGLHAIQGALKNLGHGVARSTVARVLKDNGIAPTPDRPSSWRTFLRAHWGAIAGPTSLPPRSGPLGGWSRTTRSSGSISGVDGF